MKNNLQEIFNRAVGGVVAQGKPSVNNYGLCHYRTEDGLKCAVGQLIPDDEYDPEFDIRATTTNYRVVSHIADKLGASPEFLLDLQDAHDASHRDHNFVESFIDAANRVARKYDLEPYHA